MNNESDSAWVMGGVVAVGDAGVVAVGLVEEAGVIGKPSASVVVMLLVWRRLL